MTSSLDCYKKATIPILIIMDLSQVKTKESSTSKKKGKKNRNKVSPESGSKSSIKTPTQTTLPDKNTMVSRMQE